MCASKIQFNQLWVPSRAQLRPTRGSPGGAHLEALGPDGMPKWDPYHCPCGAQPGMLAGQRLNNTNAVINHSITAAMD